MSDWDASTYDRVSDPQYRWATVVVERIDPEGVGSILDAGCGSGRVTELLLARFPGSRVIALDVSENMLAEARERLASHGDRVSFVHGDLLGPIEAGPVDAIFSNAVFHWVADHDRLYRNLASVLRPGGQLVAQWGGRGNVARVMSAAAEAGGFDLPPPTFASVDETIARLEAAGFADVRVWSHDDPASFEDREAFETYLRTVCLRCHLDLVPADERETFVGAVADRLSDNTVDYVRLNATARLGSG